MTKKTNFSTPDYTSPVCEIIEMGLESSFMQTSPTVSITGWEEDSNPLGV